MLIMISMLLLNVFLNLKNNIMRKEEYKEYRVDIRRSKRGLVVSSYNIMQSEIEAEKEKLKNKCFKIVKVRK